MMAQAAVHNTDLIELSVGVWNVGNKGDRIEDRINAIEKTLSHLAQNKPDLMLAQEVKSQTLYNALKISSSPYEDNKSVYAIFYESKRIGIPYKADITLEDLLKATKKARRPPERLINLFDKFKRIDARVCSMGTINIEKCLVVSWHGEQTRLDNIEKKEVLHDVIAVLKEVQQDKKCSVCIMGGDFNLDISHLEVAHLAGRLNMDVHKYKPSHLRQGKNTIDYLISWPSGKVKVKDVGPVDEVKECNLEVFDHQLVLYKLEIILGQMHEKNVHEENADLKSKNFELKSLLARETKCKQNLQETLSRQQKQIADFEAELIHKHVECNLEVDDDNEPTKRPEVGSSTDGDSLDSDEYTDMLTAQSEPDKKSNRKFSQQPEPGKRKRKTEATDGASTSAHSQWIKTPRTSSSVNMVSTSSEDTICGSDSAVNTSFETLQLTTNPGTSSTCSSGMAGKTVTIICDESYVQQLGNMSEINLPQRTAWEVVVYPVEEGISSTIDYIQHNAETLSDTLVIIQTGAEDTFTRTSSEVTDLLKNLEWNLICYGYKHVAFSSIREHIDNEQDMSLNHQLEEMCSRNNWVFINNMNWYPGNCFVKNLKYAINQMNG